MDIVELDYNEYLEHEVEATYTTRAYQQIKIKKKKNAVVISVARKKMRKMNKSYQIKLFEDYIDEPIAYGLFDRKQLVGFIEGEFISWNQTFRIWEVYVNPKYRKKGWGSKLFKQMERHILETNARAITLEVQSCNDPAISFYEKMGMHFIGLNTLTYSNYDVQNKEVKLEYGKRMI